MVLQDKMIEFDDVSFGYTNKDVLHHLNFTIKKGETVGIIGGTGAGKSTLVSLIGRIMMSLQDKSRLPEDVFKIINWQPLENI